MHLLLIVLLFSSLIPPSPPSSDVLPTEFVPGELIIGLQPGYAATSLAIPEKAQIKQLPSLKKLNVAVVRVPAGQENSYLRQIRTLHGVRFAELNAIVRADVIPNDPRWNDQYGPQHVQAPQAWDVTTGSSSVILAIVDSGIDPAHLEFASRILPGYDFIEYDDVPQDRCGHGTHVAGIAAATGNNSEGIAGIAWNVKILPIRVLDETCSGSLVSVAEGIVAAVERGARVINLSLGTNYGSHLLQEATFYAYTHGAALIAAAGNQGISPIAYPARYDWVLAVGATDSTDSRAAFSNYGSELDLMAPGVSILSTLPTYPDFTFHYSPWGKSTHYDTLSGTSMAAPHVAGAAALLASLPAFNTPDKIYQALTATALDMGAPGKDDYTGYGLLQIDSALHYSPSIIPTPTPSSPPLAYDVLDSPGCSNLVTYSWRDTSGGTQLLLTPGSNNGAATISLPFAFPFGGNTYTSAYVLSNGIVSFEPASLDGYMMDEFIIPSHRPGQPQNFIAPFWDDLTFQDSAVNSIWYKVSGIAPHREAIIEYRRAQRFEWGPVPGNLTFQVILFETSGEILIQYKTLRGAGAKGESATVGVEFDLGRSGLLFSYHQPALREGMALRFVPYFPHLGPPPSTLCQVYTRPADSSGGFYENPPFCLSLPAGALPHPAYVRIQPLSSAPEIPAPYLDLHHYADIRLLYLSPPIPISPMPEAYVCYRYTPADVLQAGGHPENLRIMLYDSARQRWQALPTSVDTLNGLIFARSPHLSLYGIATFGQPQALPVTGASFWWNETTRWAWMLALGLILLLWLVFHLRRLSDRA